MSILANRAQLLQVLETVRPGLSSKETIQQSTAFVFQDGVVSTFNDEVSCRTKSGLPRDFAGAVPSDPLLRALQKMSEEEVSLTAKGGELRVKGKGREVGVRMEAEIVLPLDLVEPPGEWADLPENFEDALKTVVDVTGTNAEEFFTVCVQFTPDWVEATDRFQIARYNLDTGADSPFLVRSASLKPLIALNPTRVSQTKEWLHFRNPAKLFYSCRRHVYDQYPDLGQYLEFTGTPTVLPKGAADAAQLAAIFSGEDKDNDKVSVTLSRGTMTVRGEASYGWAREEMRTTYDGPTIEFRISPALLTQIVTRHNECRIEPGRLKVEGNQWTYVASLGSPSRAPAELPADAEPVPAEASAEE